MKIKYNSDGSEVLYDGSVYAENILKNNFDAELPPGSTDDDSEGYAIGSEWIDTVSDILYRCMDATEGAAIWIVVAPVTMPSTGSKISMITDQSVLSRVTIWYLLGWEHADPVRIDWGDGTHIDLTGYGGSVATVDKDYSSTGSYTITLTGPLDVISRMDIVNPGIIGRLDDFVQAKRIKSLSVYNTKYVGNIETLKDLSYLEELNISRTAVVGDIGTLTALTALRELWANDTALVGDLQAFININDIAIISLLNVRGIYGDVKNLEKLTSLTFVGLGGSAITGTLASLGLLTALTFLAISNTGITGDLTALSGISALGSLEVSNTQITGYVSDCAAFADTRFTLIADHSLLGVKSATLPSFHGRTLSLVNCRLSAAEIDMLCLKLQESTAEDGYLYLWGNNAAPTSNSAAARTWLLSTSWDVAVTEEIRLTTDQTSSVGLLFTLRLDLGSTLYIDWGDSVYEQTIKGRGNVDIQIEKTYGATGTYPVRFYGDYDGVSLFDISNTNFTGDISKFKCLDNALLISVANTGISGDISSMSYSSSAGAKFLLEIFKADNTSITGHIGGLISTTRTRLQEVTVSNTSLSGDLSATCLGSNTGLCILNIADTTCNIDVSAYSVMKNIKYLDVSGSAVTGTLTIPNQLGSARYLDISDTSLVVALSTLSQRLNIQYLKANDSGVTGNLSDLSSFTDIREINLKNTAVGVTSDAVGPWSDVSIDLTDCSLTATEVDNALIQLNAAGGTGGTLLIAGSNAARTSASDTAYTNLGTNGWAITVN